MRASLHLPRGATIITVGKVAENNRTTLIVAVAGIAATALIGLAGTGAAWLSSRDDRRAQRDLAQDSRTYDHRVSAYLDAIDFIVGQERSYATLLYVKGTFGDDLAADPADPVVSRLTSDLFLEVTGDEEEIPIRLHPPSRLTSRLGAFGSAQAFNTFQEAERRFHRISYEVTSRGPGRQKLMVSAIRVGKPWIERLQEFAAQVDRFRAVVHKEIG